jgi:hypothetical protein
MALVLRTLFRRRAETHCRSAAGHNLIVVAVKDQGPDVEFLEIVGEPLPTLVEWTTWTAAFKSIQAQ